MVLLNREQIKEVIPHREPFLLIDEVTALDAGSRCVARNYVKEEDFWFRGHFPSYPVTPGVLIVEMLAQTGAVCVGALEEYRGKIAFLAKIDKVKFKKQVVAGDILTLEVDMIRLKSKVGVGRGTAKVGEDIACICEITFMFQE